MFDVEKVCNLLHSHFKEEKDDLKKILFGNIMKEIRQNPLVKKEYSKEELESAVNHIIHTITYKEENKQVDYINTEIARINRELQDSLGVWNFIIPIDNMEIKLKKLQIGDVTFCKFTSYRRKKERKRIWDIIKNNPHYSLEWKKKQVKFYDENTFSQLHDKTCALVQITGRLEKAHYKAYEKVETAIAILKYYLRLNDPSRYFHVIGKVISNIHRFTLRYKEDGKEYNTFHEQIGPLFPFELDKREVQIMRRLGFNKVNNILKKENPSPLELNIFNSIRFLGAAYDVIIDKSTIRRPIYWRAPVDEDNKPSTVFVEIAMNDRFVKLFVVLESLFIFNDNEPLQSNLSERLAYLLGKTYDERKKIISYIINMHKVRSSYIHHGESKLNHKMLNGFTYFVRGCIERLIYIINRFSLKNEDDLKQWFEKKKLS